MIRFTKYVFLLSILLSFAACSSDSSDPIEEEIPLGPTLMQLSINGDEIRNNAHPQAPFFRSEDTFIYNTDTDDLGLSFSFDKSGRLGFVSYKMTVGPGSLTRKFSNFRNYASHYFTFNIIAVDEEHRRVKGSFSGYLYANPENLNSESKFISCNFELDYKDIIPDVFGTKNEAKIDGIQWSRINRFYSRSLENSNYVIENTLDDGPYKITINYNPQTNGINTGVYNFTAADVTNKVVLFRFNRDTSSFIQYNCSGTLRVTRRERIDMNTFILSGTYDFTAVNVNDAAEVIDVTEGIYKIIYRAF